MVLAQLGESLVGALARMAKSTVVDDKVVVDCLNDVSRALLQADVRFVTVRAVQASIRSAVNLQSLAAGTDRRRAIKHAVVDELRRMLDPAAGSGKPPPFFVPRKGRKPANVVMFVGLQGSGKTTTCVKYADYHRRTGFSPALVCADTFRAGALDQLRQNAAKAGIPFYGSYTESDPVRVAVEGVDRFRNDQAAEGCDLIVVDTSGRHSQEAALLEEMRQLATVKGASFTFTLRALYSQFRLVQSMGPLGRLVSFLSAGLLGDKGKQEKEGQQAKIKRYMTIMDSMSAAELDGADPMKLMMTKQQQSRINWVARGSGRPVSQVVELLQEHKRMAKLLSKFAPAHVKRQRPNNKHIKRTFNTSC